jgi:signal transduction histidine kinase
VALVSTFGGSDAGARALWPPVAAAAVIGAAIGAAVFVAMRSLPLRVLHSAIGALNDEVQQHAESRRSAEAESRSRSRLLAAATHDLRQPLHALGLYAAILEEKLNEPELRQLTQNIHDSVGALETLFGEVTDLSKLDAGMLHASVAAFPVDAVLGALRSSFEQAARSKGIDFQVKPCP